MNESDNPQLDLAYRFISETRCSVFLTGRAGTGKTTFLRSLMENPCKRMLVAAPTGVAAINAGGTTLHSLFQLAFTPYIPGLKQAGHQHKFTKRKIDLLRSINLLIIDEISMVRADVLDAVSDTLKRIRHSEHPFGGVQLLLIGDIQQLPPVIKDDELQLLKPYYESFFFFGSQELNRTHYVSIELKHIYRQTDPQFIELLNTIRTHQWSQQTIQLLNDRYQANFKIPETEFYITLTTHHSQSNEINARHLSQIKKKSVCFEAIITGDFPESHYPLDAKSHFKVGAQVMFAKNDENYPRRYFNGKIGRITEIDSTHVTVLCDGEEEAIVANMSTWKRCSYTIDDQNKEIREEVLGTFTQIPLRLAWSITIHKSQGLTFDRVIIDAGAAFAHGQVYVALSRCRTLEGIVLRSKILPNGLSEDSQIRSFETNYRARHPNQEEVDIARKEYQLFLLDQLFDFGSTDKLWRQLIYHFKTERKPFGNAIEMAPQIYESFKKDIVRPSRIFMNWIHQESQQQGDLEVHEAVQLRLIAASEYFSNTIRTSFLQPLGTWYYSSDNEETLNRIAELYQNLQEALHKKLKAFESCLKGFITKDFQHQASLLEIEELRAPKLKSFPTEESPQLSDIEIALFEALSGWRKMMALENGIGAHRILKNRSLQEIVMLKPCSIGELKRINGIGEKKLQAYGSELIDIVLMHVMPPN